MIKYKIKLNTNYRLKLAPLLSILLFFSVSCNDDLLDISPRTDISEADIFSSAELLERYVNGRYYALAHYDFGIMNTDSLSDDINASANDNANAYHQLTINSESGIPINNWVGTYGLIRETNFFFSRIGYSSVEDDVKKRLTGEMRFIRAWLYADLISLYGDVILITDLPKLGQENYDKAKTPYQEVVKFIVDELTLAADELPNVSFAANGRINKGVALALKARTLLYAASPLHNGGSYDKDKLKDARDAAQDVIDLGTFRLEPDFANIYKHPYYSDEILFARTFNAEHRPFNLFGVTSADRYYLPTAYSDVDLSWYQPTQSLVDAFETVSGFPISDPASGYNPQNPYINRDPRLSKTIIHHGSVLKALPGVTDRFDNGNGTVTITFHRGLGGANGNSYSFQTNSSYNALKRANPGEPMRGVRNSYSPWIHFRLAEMYLIVAEAEAEMGNPMPAMNALNAVRQRVSMPLVSGLSGSVLQERYRNERRVELALENLRWYDITRWKIAPQVLNQPAYGVSISRDYSQSPPVDSYNYTSNRLGNRIWDDKKYFLPIPNSEIQANNLLEQNKDYN